MNRLFFSRVLLVALSLSVCAHAVYGATAPLLGVSINAQLGQEISGPVVVYGGSWVSGGSASGTGSCNMSFIGGGGSGATATLGVNSGVINPALTITNEGSGYTSAPTSATLSSGTATCSGTATVLTHIGDPLGLTGVLGVVSTNINPVGISYNANSETYSGLTITVKNSANGITLPCSSATAIVTLNDASAGGNDTMKVSNCSLYLITPTNVVAKLTATIAFPPNTLTLPAPLPLIFSSSLAGPPTSQATYTCVDATFCPGQVNSSATLGIASGSSISTEPCTSEVPPPSGCGSWPSLTLNGSGTPTPLSFSAQVGGSSPPTQSVSVATSPVFAMPYAVTVSTKSGGNWLSASPTGGTTGGSFNVGASPAGLAAGSYQGTVTVYTSALNSPLPITVNFTVNPAAAPPTITTTTLPNGEVGAPYPANTALTATGGTPPYSSWTVSTGTLPAGLSLNASSGVISGTPTVAGTSNFSVTVKDSVGSTSPAKALSIVIIAGPTITTTSLPGGEIGVSYSQNLGVSGGTSPYTWTLTSGLLPAGLTLSSSGTISGSPTTAGASSFSVSVKDSLGSPAGPQSLQITIVAGPTIITSSLPGGELGVAYSQTLAASGGTSPYTWTITSGTLPGGLTLNASSGLINGTPSATGTFPFTVTVKDVDGKISPAVNLSIAITGVTITSTSPLPNGTVGVAYSQTLTATGGTGPYTWTVSGALPGGLTLSSAGVITGNPTTAGTSSFNVTAKDSLGSPSPSTAFSLTVVNPLLITTTSPLPSGIVGVAYSDNLAATGGTSPYTWSLTTGTLPGGLTLSSSGAITGTPTTTGSSSFSVSVKDSAGLTAGPQSLTITINAALTITTKSPLPNGVVTVPYSTTLNATGGIQPYSSWTVTTGTLPAGLSLGASTGVISGTPTAAGTSTVTVTVKDSAGNTSPAASLSITIVSGLTIITTSLPNATVGVAYNQTLQVAGGVPPYSSWTVSTGSLPTGLTLNASTGVISGTATTAGSGTPFSVTVKDSANTTSPAQQLSITVVNIVTITTTSLSGGTVGASYSQALAATNGTPPYSSWTIASGALPPGLTLNSGTGIITGAPTTATGTPFAFTVTVKDSNGVTSAAASLSIAIATTLTITTTSLPNGTVGTAYSQTLGAAGGTAPYTWTLTSGTLPGGLTLSSSGGITGTPTTAGTSSFSVSVKDNIGNTAGPLNLAITITPVLTITTTTLPSATVGVAYSSTLTATGGTTPYAWTMTTGSLPPGLSLSSAGVISGSPTTATGSPFAFSVTVKDNTGSTAVASLSITVATGPLTITTSSLPGGVVGIAYSQTLGASGGVPPYSSWTVSTGSLPAGLTLNSSTGTISGTPTALGTASFSVTVKDSGGTTSPAKALTITIAGGLTITTTSLPSAAVGVAYTATLTATGGVPPYSNWVVTSGALPAGLTLNASTGAITGTPTTATGSPFAFSVTVTDSAKTTTAPAALSITVLALQLKATPSAVFFTLANTAPPATSTLSITATDGSAQPFTVTAAPAAFNWLTFSPASSTTPGNITLTATPAKLVPGTYLAQLIVKSGALSLTVNAQLVVTGSNLTATPSMLAFGNYQPGTPPPAPQNLTISPATGTTPVPLASVTTDVTWLKVTSAASAPATVQVSLNPGLLTAGTYTGYVLVQGSGSPTTSLNIPVTVTVNAEPPLTAAPTTLSFSSQIGGAAPAAQTFTVSAGNVALNFSATSPGNWLQVVPIRGTTPGTVTVTANPAGLGAGTYGGNILVTALGASSGASVAVTLTVSGPTQLTVAPSQLLFSSPVGGPAPVAQTVMVTSTSGSALGFTAAAGSAWLSVTPTSGTTPASLSVSVNVTGLASGTYSGTINVTQNGTSVPQTIMVTLQVGTSATTPTITGLINAASGAIGKVSPGMAVSIFGEDLGPTTAVSFSLPPTGETVATTLGGTQVLFDGVPVPLLFSSNGQVNALAPFELAGKTTTSMQVSYGGVTSTASALTVVPAEPGVFTLNATGAGQGSILNQDYSINGTASPAAAGSAVMIFGTGGGVTVPPSTDGGFNPVTTTGSLALPVTATVGGQAAQVLYFGPAPGLVSGIIQVNVTIPSGTPSGNAPVVITIGGVSSQTGVTVAVQ